MDCLGVYRNPSLSCLQKAKCAWEVKDARSLLSVADWPLEGFLCLFGLVTVHLWMCSRIQMPEDQEIKCFVFLGILEETLLI